PSTERPGKATGAADNSYRGDMSDTQRPTIWPKQRDPTALFRSPGLNDAIEFPIPIFHRATSSIQFQGW
ncbi:MAG: hypothetical protein ACI88G_001464, partial [Woeseiaceae bacterium]